MHNLRILIIFCSACPFFLFSVQSFRHQMFYSCTLICFYRKTKRIKRTIFRKWNAHWNETHKNVVERRFTRLRLHLWFDRYIPVISKKIEFFLTKIWKFFFYFLLGKTFLVRLLQVSGRYLDPKWSKSFLPHFCARFLTS